MVEIVENAVAEPRHIVLPVELIVREFDTAATRRRGAESNPSKLTGGASMKIGFVGLGVMGLGMVPRLQAAGYKVTGWNRTKDKAKKLIDSGMRWADTPRAVARSVRRRVLRW